MSTEMAPHEFIELVTNDPLFAAEGMDLERGLEALAATEQVVGEIQKLYTKNSFAIQLFFTRYPMTTHALPLPFVKALIESEHARRVFTQHPSRAHAEALLDAWEYAAAKLTLSLKRYRLMHTYAFFYDKASIGTIHDMFGNTITHADMMYALDLLEQNANAVAQEVAARRAAYIKGVVVHSALQNKQKEVAYKPAVLTKEYEWLHSLERKDGLPFRAGEVLEEYGPFTHTLAQFDGTNTPHTFMAYVVHKHANGIMSFRASVADVFLFSDLASEKAKHHEVNKLNLALLTKGIRYWYQSASNLYTSRDQSYWADIATIVDLHRRPALNKKRVGEQRSSMLDLLLGALYEDHVIYFNNAEELVRKSGRMPKPLSPLLFRTVPSLYYMSFNKSIWRLEKEPVFLGSTWSKENPLYESAESVLAQATPDEIKLAMKSSRIREETRRSERGF